MTIQIRQMLIKSTVGLETAIHPMGSPRLMEQWKEDVLAECKVWFDEKFKEKLAETLNELQER